jgi:hypothetical protein
LTFPHILRLFVVSAGHDVPMRRDYFSEREIKMKSYLLITLSVSLVFAADWHVHKSDAGGFSIMFPGAPQEQVNTIDTDIGPLDMVTTTYEAKNYAYMASYADYPENAFSNTDIEEVLDSARDRAIANVQGTLLSEEKISMGRFPGRSFKAEINAGQTVLMARICLAGFRLYMVGAVVPKNDVSLKDNTRFFESFTLEEGVDVTLVARLLVDLGFGYEKDENGQYYFEIDFDDDRSQLVYITPLLDDIHPGQIYDIWSPVASLTDTLSALQSHILLKQNGSVEIGAFQLLEYPDKNVLVFSAQLTTEPEAELLQKYILKIASTADDLEDALFETDEY